MEVINALGRRKSAVARVFVSEGTGKITINKKTSQSTFHHLFYNSWLNNRSRLLKYWKNTTSRQTSTEAALQASHKHFALLLPALVKINPEDKAALRKEGFMTRDSREVERKKPGRPKARRRFQFSKR